MRPLRAALGARGLCLLAVLPLRCVASPSINVALNASFGAPPYLVELLETAAEENATAYFPLLDRIADGYFSGSATDRELYTAFEDLLQHDGHITDAETLSTFRFALSMHAAAPRIEAHYQFYNTSAEPSMKDNEDRCDVWVAFGGKQYCSPARNESSGSLRGERTYELPFDRILGDSHAAPSILYADILSPSFAQFHQAVSKAARAGRTSYRVRYKPSLGKPRSPLVVSGYGVELALKRTDYIVIDDRPAQSSDAEPASRRAGAALDDEDVADLKPLSASEVAELGFKSASFALQSDEPLDTLLKLSQDFPKHSSAIVSHNVSADFVSEHNANRAQWLPAGYNMMWINGLQIPQRDVSPFTLLEKLRRERRLINSMRSLGLAAPDAIRLLSHPAIAETLTEGEPQRYDFRDEVEGGDVIIWMNNIEKDKRYEDWPTSLKALLQRTFPGQLPPVRRDIHNVIVPVDFTSSWDVALVVETIQSVIKRKVPARWGLVPATPTPGAADQAKVVYYLQETYGLSTVLDYLASSALNKKLSSPDKVTFDTATRNGRLRKEQAALDLSDVLATGSRQQQISGATKYLHRLAADGPSPPVFVNGVPIPRSDDWLQALSSRISMDLRSIQKGVYENVFQQDAWIPFFFLFQAALRRAPLIIPENENDVTLLDMATIHSLHANVMSALPTIEATSTEASSWAHLIVVGDFDAPTGRDMLKDVAAFRKEQDGVEIQLLHCSTFANHHTSSALAKAAKNAVLQLDDLEGILSTEHGDAAEADPLWSSALPLVRSLGFEQGQYGLVLNGRAVGPLPHGQVQKEDLESLLVYERRKRIEPAMQAVEDSESQSMSSPLAVAKLTSLVALSTVSDVPEGIFDSAPTWRNNKFNLWQSSSTAIVQGDMDTAVLQIVASVDPATELAQRWIPTLKTLSQLDGVHLRLYLNPKEKLSELPVKRFYRYLLDAKPSFGDDGEAQAAKARFTGVPAEALLTAAMDVPPSWLVAPKESVHDLDNIKLSSLSGGGNIDAVYELESILIEGHSRDVSSKGTPPRGAELVLSTEKKLHFADTIIMANLGYFQFKVNPGLFKINLKAGRSDDVFRIDSAGTQGWAPQPGDETTEILLMDFQGTTIFPRLSRKPGKEEEDVLSGPGSLAGELVAKGANFANQLLAKAGMPLVDGERILAKGSELWSRVAPKAASRSGVQADINIFSVASGHLYERMLNIMMVSVMRHTKHSVKFWFIEQFLSPSFKTFLPAMAAEYGFEYEMVTYKWPHWLRGQKEKQREIWGYKILFLDVLFPLDLDKVIFVDADQIVRTDMHELVAHDLQGAPYGFTPMCDSRTEMEGFRFWKQGYWKTFLRGLPYHISALYVVDLKRFRQLAAGDRLRQQYHSLSADPASLSNLDQDLPNNMQMQLPIHSLPQHWLWCETWCSDESLADAKTIDLCNNPLTKEPKLDRARRQVPEWTAYDDEIAALARRVRGREGDERPPLAAGSDDGGGPPQAKTKDEL